MHSAPEDRQLFLTYTCPVSRFTYAGHPRRGTLYEHTNDLLDAVTRIKRLAEKHEQPVSWVINDQEYLNLEGLLPRFLEWQQQGDSVLVTMELTTSPDGVEKSDTSAVLRWIAAQCEKAGLTPDGLWSLKFLESDLRAILMLDEERYSWTRNLAGSCWAQEGIDDSTWLGCPYGPYFPAVWNSRCPADPGEQQQFVMLEWLTRDITAIASGGFPATFSLDPADANRKDAGGFANESDALRYSVRLIEESARQIAFNKTAVVNINEEARHYQTEGHDKDFMLDGMFGAFARIALDPPVGVEIRQASYKQVWKAYRDRYHHTPEGVFLTRDLDWRSPPVAGASDEYNQRIAGDVAALYQNWAIQAVFLRSRGSLPVQLFDYATRVPGADGNDPYPVSQPAKLGLRQLHWQESERQISVDLTIASASAGNIAIALWEIPVKGDEQLAANQELPPQLKAVRVCPGVVLLHLELEQGVARMMFELSKTD